ncbi:hypothetical protein BG011_008202 [Mortierella polycephala]|uniref:Transcription factor TFIIIC triple barrel domain-containing protein n=1 Tax=Mortierella polycephala TaxID=41804 RepID=A0A9P6PQ36_9FUNG|nr:hypothetical protein BG011_008202 [Mortierella polycephala]
MSTKTKPAANSQSSYISNASIQIDAQFQDLVREPKESSAASSTVSAGKKSSQVSTSEIGDDSQDWEWVEESEYIVLDFGGATFDANDMANMTSKGYSLVGMDTPTPYFQAGVHTFKGFYDENAITEDLLFDMTAREEAEEGLDDSDDEAAESLDLIAIVTKRVIFEPIELFPKTSNHEPEPTSEVLNEDITKGTKKSIWQVAREATEKESSSRYHEPATAAETTRDNDNVMGDSSSNNENGRGGAASTSRSVQAIDVTYSHGKDDADANEDDLGQDENMEQ